MTQASQAGKTVNSTSGRRTRKPGVVFRGSESSILGSNSGVKSSQDATALVSALLGRRTPGRPA